MKFIISLIASLATLAAAAPAADLEVRQGGYYAVGNQYSGGGCTPSSLIFADPIYVENGCVALDRFNTGYTIVSYELLSENAGCSVKLYTTTDCSGTSFSATVNNCVQASSPFKTAYVTCTS